MQIRPGILRKIRNATSRRLNLSTGVRWPALESLSLAAEANARGTMDHSWRVLRHALRLARRLHLPNSEAETLRLAALLHDVGKAGVPEAILSKAGPLTDQEFGDIAAHVELGAELVAALRLPYPVCEAVLSHHEHWDGSGYPRKLAGMQICRVARILTVVDCFDALISDRPYRAALPVERAVRIMRPQRGRMFDPEVLDGFLRTLPAFAKEPADALASDGGLRNPAPQLPPRPPCRATKRLPPSLQCSACPGPPYFGQARL